EVDLAVADTVSLDQGYAANVTIMTGDGKGGFTVSNQLIANPFSSNRSEHTPITVLNPAGDLAINTTTGVSVFLNNGNGSYFPSTSYAPKNSINGGITAGDFLGDGVNELAFTDYVNSTVSILSGSTAGNLATFLPGQSMGTAQGLVSASLNDALNQ